MDAQSAVCPNCGSLNRQTGFPADGEILICSDCRTKLTVQSESQEQSESRDKPRRVPTGTIPVGESGPYPAVATTGKDSAEDTRGSELPTGRMNTQPAGRIAWLAASALAAAGALFFLVGPDESSVDLQTDPMLETDKRKAVSPAAEESTKSGGISTSGSLPPQTITSNSSGIEPPPLIPRPGNLKGTLSDTEPNGDQPPAGIEPSGLNPASSLGKVLSRLWHETAEEQWLDPGLLAAWNRAGQIVRTDELPPIDIPLRLDQRLLVFEQTEPSPIRAQFKQLEEMIGVPVVLDKASRDMLEASLDKPVRFTLKDCRVADILELLTQELECDYEVLERSIRIRPRISDGSEAVDP